jgi:hypothetical protein
MHTKNVIFVVLSALLVASIYSISSSIVFALIKKGDEACVKTTKNGITTETCCHNETDTQTGKKIQYCTECKTLQDGSDLGCTHLQTDLTKTSMVQGVKPGNAPQSTEQPSNGTGVMKGGNVLKNGGLLK